MEDTSKMPGIQESQGAAMSAVAITKEKLFGNLKGLKLGKSPGPDGLHSRFLKAVAVEMQRDK